MIKLINIVGARPQFVKLNAICRAIDKFNKDNSRKSRINQIIIHTGQHYDYTMNDVFFEELNIPKADYNLGVGSASHARQTGLMLERIEKVLKKKTPDVVVVYGDTNSTLAGALAAAKLNIPIAHVEAGLRSFDKGMPEEVNRVVTDRLSKFLFCPTETAVTNLVNEGIREGIFKVGDVMFDALLFYAAIAEEKSNILRTLGLRKGRYYLSTIHRQENTDDLSRLKVILEGLNEVANEANIVVLPLHPRTKKAINSLKFRYHPLRLRMIPPASYLDMLILEKNAKTILTDSGGVQKEAYFLKVPCVTLRDHTEWIETVQSGWNVLAGIDSRKISNALKRVYSQARHYRKFYGNGEAGRKIVNIIAKGFCPARKF